jgi:cobalt-zinc-cadmium efflux system outer membrane protein
MFRFSWPLLLAATAGIMAMPAYADDNAVVSSSIAAPNTPLALQDAWRLAEQANVSLRQEQARLAAFEGEAQDSRSLLHNNPRLVAEQVRRDVRQAGLPTERRLEWSAGVEQTFEIAGQQGYRRNASQADLDALKQSIEETRHAVRADVERQFVQVLALQERIVTERTSLQLVEDAAASVGKRVAAGEDSRLDGNLATVEAARARNQIAALEEQLIQARSELAALLQLPASALPAVAGALDTPTPAYTLEQLLAQAQSRPLMRVLDLREHAARQRLSLERATRYPDVTVGLSRGREGAYDARENLNTLTVSLPLPLFQRNAAGIGRASTELTQAEIERQATLRNIPSQVTALWQKLQSLQRRVEELQRTVLPTLEENKRLSIKSMQAGEISLVQLLLVNRQVLDGRRDLIDAESELRLTRIALHQAAGWHSSPGSP